jgi:hypothetical protein
VEEDTRATNDHGLRPAARTRRLKTGQQVDLTSTLEKNNDQDMNSRQLIIKHLIAISGMGNEWQPEK